MTRLLGHDPEMLEDDPSMNIVAPCDRPRFDARLASACRGATSARPVTTRIGLLRHDRVVAVPFDLSIVNLLDDPTVEGLVISGHDATAEMSAERELERGALSPDRHLGFNRGWSSWWSTAGTITDFNRRFAEIWGLPHNAVARQDDLSTLAFALDQFTDPDAFAAREELDLQPDTESFDLIELKDEPCGRAVLKAPRSTGRSWDGSTAFET